MSPTVVLVGPPGSGKSTVARALAATLGTPTIDSDDVIEERVGKSIADIFIEDGEEAFRAAERDVVAELLANWDGILSLGGGAILDAQTQADLLSERVVFLNVSLGAAAPRIGLAQSRPLLVDSPRARWNALMAQRLPIYERVAWMTIPTDKLSATDVAERIASRIA